MKKRTTITAVVAGTLLVSGFAGAHGHQGAFGPDVLFERFDTDGDGVITRAEADATVATRFDQTDADGNGTLSSAELAAAKKQRMLEWVERRAQRFADSMVRHHDQNDDGELSLDELSAQRMSRLFKRLDADSDASITREEVDDAWGDRCDEPRGGWHGPAF